MASTANSLPLIFDKEKWKKGFIVEMKKASTQALTTAGEQCFKELGKDDPFHMPPGAALKFLDDRENLMAGVADEVHERVLDQIKQSLESGDTMAQIAERVRREFNDIDKGRGLVIAQTETAAAYGTARHEAMQQAGTPYKGWLTSGNANVRPAHAAANGQTVEINEPFYVDGEQLQFPGDPSGSAGNVISCHCVQIAKSKKD
jgi:SPP1 gp7 family putative phage head morphogenesis protein